MLVDVTASVEIRYPTLLIRSTKLHVALVLHKVLQYFQFETDQTQKLQNINNWVLP